jgi:hypothetical protein
MGAANHRSEATHTAGPGMSDSFATVGPHEFVDRCVGGTARRTLYSRIRLRCRVGLLPDVRAHHVIRGV